MQEDVCDSFIFYIISPVLILPVAVCSGAPVQLGIVIEGESLLNDGAAIVLFEVLKTELLPGTAQTGRYVDVIYN